MGWYESLSGSNKQDGARQASVAETIEIKRYRASHPPLKSDESLAWKGNLFTGYHLYKVEKAETGTSTEYLKTHLPGYWAKID